MTFKQQYLNRSGPFPFNFNEERASMINKIMQIVRSLHPNEWAMRGLYPLSFLESYKQVYGITTQQLTQTIQEMFELLKLTNLSCQGYINITKVIAGLKQYKIALSQQFKFDNKYFLNKLKQLSDEGIPFALKNSDTFMQNLIKVIRSYSKYGQQHFDQIIELAVNKRDIKYIALFVKSIKKIETAQNVLDYIFEESSVFQRQISFFYIVSELTLEFPNLDLRQYYHTLSQEIIKTITTIVDPNTEDDIKKLTQEDPCIGVQCTLKSIAKILIYSLKPVTEPGWDKMWSCIQRIFSIISGLIDHSHEVECMNDFLIFMKDFVKYFQQRYRKERGMFKEVNEDFIENFSDPLQKEHVIGEKYLNLFNQMWTPLIPQLMYFQDGDVRAAKILSDLAMFQPQKYLPSILQQIISYLQKDLTIVSIYTPKMTILFLQQFIINNYLEQHQFSLLIQCCQSLLDAIQKLGISQNLDILQLVIRCYMYIPEGTIDEKPILQSLTDDIIQIMQQNLDPMSINLQSTQGQEAQLYTDFKNIYFNFIVRLNKQQLSRFCDKLMYKIRSTVPEHRQAYEFIVVALCYMQPQLSKKILDYTYKQIVVHNDQSTKIKQNGSNGDTQTQTSSLSQQVFPYYLDFSLATKNEENLKWYTSMLKCAFQYNPDIVVAEWAKIQTIVVVLLREWDNPNLFDWGLDIIFNIIINLEHVHLQPREFFKDTNRSYSTIEKINWIHPSSESIQLLEHIKETFYESITKFMIGRYGAILQDSQKAQKIKSQKVIQILLERSQTTVGPKPIEVKSFLNQILDCLLVPSTPTAEDLEQKKNINKLLSVQYSIFSAMQMRSQFTSKQDMFQIDSVFIKQLGCMRRHAIEHLKWVLQLFGHYNCMYDQTLLKLFHYFWRESHDELYFSEGIQATNDKLRPYFYPTSYKKKQLFQNAYLIVTQCYVTFMMRIQLFSMLKPMAYLNNPQFLSYMVPFCFSSVLDTSIKSYIPSTVDIHNSYHFQILNICRHKLSLYNPNSYIRKFTVYSKAGNQGINKIEKQKYLGAIRVIVSNFKRSMNVFAYPCCMKDETSWFGIQEMLQVSQYLEKKTDKVGIIQVIYLLVIFSFDFKGNLIYTAKFNQVEKNLATFNTQDAQMLHKVVGFIKFLIQKINGELIKKFFEKDSTVLVLLLICYSQFVPLDNQIYQQIIPLVIQITLKNSLDMMNMGKSFLFRILNRYIKKKGEIAIEQNTPIKRSYEDFLVFRHIGGRTMEGTDQPAANLITSKTDNYYYPTRNLQYIYRVPLDPHKPNEALLLSKIQDQQVITLLFKSISTDTELKSNQSEVDVSYLNEEEPKRIYSNGHKLVNYLLDNNPKKLDIFLSFIDNFSNYPICFYHRLFRKMIILGGSETIKICQDLSKQFIKSSQKQQVKLCQFLLVQILPFCFNDEEFYAFYTNFLVTCSKQQFQIANACLIVIFFIDWRISKIIFNKIIGRMRQQKGPSRLRHLQVFNNYILCSGRFSREEAKNGIHYLMKGIEEGTDEVSELIVSMLIYCFIVPINLKLMGEWVNESILQLVQKNRIYKLDSQTGYEIHESVRLIIKQIIFKTTQEKNLQSKNLQIYSQIAYKILSNITVYRFNDEFYSIFKDIMVYIINRPLQEGSLDEQIVNQLKNSEYPQHIYNDLLGWLKNMEGNTTNVIKKKLKYIENIVINKNFCTDSVDIPDIFESLAEKQVIIDHIVAASNMARIMKDRQLTNQVEKLLKTEPKTTKTLNFMMAYLLAAGTRDFEWRQSLLHHILSFKKYKIVKEFVSYWWKGRNPESDKQQRLCMLVRSVQNPYSYFA